MIMMAEMVTVNNDTGKDGNHNDNYNDVHDNNKSDDNGNDKNDELIKIF